MDKDPFAAVLEVKSSREMIQVALKCQEKKGKEDYCQDREMCLWLCFYLVDRRRKNDSEREAV